MLRKFFALVVLALILCPFTAPFQTCDLSQASSPVVIDENTGSLGAPLITEAGRLKIAPLVGIVVVSHPVPKPPVTCRAWLAAFDNAIEAERWTPNGPVILPYGWPNKRLT